MSDIAIYGLGEMGSEIARCLMSRGSSLAAYDPATSLGNYSSGFVRGGSVGEVAGSARVHLIVVKHLPDLERLLLADDGLGARAAKKSLIVLHTTVPPLVVRDLRQRVEERYGHTLIDAALSRRSGRISEGSLSLLVGATDAEFVAARPVLDVYADNVVHVGPPGAGMTAKLCNNWLLYSNRHAALQALKVGQNLGLDVDVLRVALAASTGSSWALMNFSDLDVAILEGRGAPAVVHQRTSSELSMVREMVTESGELPTTLDETFALLEAMRPLPTVGVGPS